MLEIGLSGLLLDRPYSGTAAYTRALVSRLPEAAPDLRFRLFVRDAGWDSPLPAAQRLRTPFRSLPGAFGARLDKLVWEAVSLPVASSLRGEALLHSMYFAAPPVSAAQVVVTIHDLIPLILPDYHRGYASRLYTRFMQETARRAGAVITVSEHSRRDIIRELGVPEDRVHVTPEGVDRGFSPEPLPDEAERLRARYNLPARYLMYLGGAEQRKNIATLVRGFGIVREEMSREDASLVIVADFPPPDALYPDIPRLVRELELENVVRIVPCVDEFDKAALYRQALGFCFPSIYEGFGLPPLEAMACGTPVIASRASSLPEVVGDGGWLLDPHDLRAWAYGMLELVSLPTVREELRERGLAQANRFDWQRTAEQTVHVYRQVLSG